MFCGIQTQQDYKPYKLLLYSFVILSSLVGGLRLLLKWIQYKDFFPLKERSPILCISLLLVLIYQTNLYPFLVLYYFFFSEQTYGNTFRILYTGVHYIPYCIYVFRSLRIIYAYGVQSGMRNNKIFRFFKSQWNFITIIIILWILKSIPPAIWQNVYVTPIDIVNDKQIQNAYLIKKFIVQTIWNITLLMCLWKQRKIQQDFGIIRQIAAILILSIIINAFQIIFATIQIYKIQQESVEDAVNLLNCNHKFPLNQYINILQNLVMIIISLLIPLFRIREYHTLLPIQQTYDIDNNIRTFLLEPLCYRVFYKYLSKINNNQTDYLNLMKFWSKITKMKLQDQFQIYPFTEFLKNIPEVIIKKSSISNLKQSILKLNDSVENDQLRHSINEAIQDIELTIIQNITKIYKQKFRRTYSYFKLKSIMLQNDRINTNLLLLGMILREQFQIEQ